MPRCVGRSSIDRYHNERCNGPLDLAPPDSCPKGKIRRSSYMRKSHSRKSYRRSEGVHVRSSYVDRARVPSACVPDKGKPGKTPKSKRILPKFSGELSLRHYGYTTSKSSAERHSALDKAAKATQNPLEILRHLNLLRNYQADPHAKEVLGKDVKYMSEQYKQKTR